jgi:hypothetical protein
MNMTRAEELFAKILANEASEIDAMIATPVTEELFLDYKQCATGVGAKALHRDDRKNFAKAVSGFGNSDGGLVVWGVICAQGPNGDVPSGPAHVYNALAFKTLLDGAIGGLTIPSHRLVENVALQVDHGPRGFVVTHVPPGHDVPFWSIDESARGYYLRAGSSFQPVPPGILAAMFGRRPNPQLKLVVRPNFDFSPGARAAALRFDISAQNNGRGIGETVYLGVHAVDGNGLSYEPVFSEPPWNKLPSAADADRWLLFTEALRFPPGSDVRLGSMGVRIEPRVVNDLKLRLHLGVVGGAGDEEEIDLSSETIRFIHENLVHPYDSDSTQQSNARSSIYKCIDADQKSRQRSNLIIPSQLLDRS